LTSTFVEVFVLFVVSAPGTAAAGARGVTLLEAAEAEPVPALFVAVTVKVYAVPFVSPVTVTGLVAPVAEMPPGLEVTVYVVIAAPPEDAGGVKLTVACAFPAVAVTPVGAPGTTALTVKLRETCVAGR
jgi:hypothetical protein